MREKINEILENTSDFAGNITLINIEENSSHCAVTLSGGMNGHGILSSYLEQLHDLVLDLEQEFEDVWLIKWENDVLDDVWYLEIGIKK